MWRGDCLKTKITFDFVFQTGRAIRHRACALKDTAHAMIKAELDPEFEKLCREVAESRKKRGNIFLLDCVRKSVTLFCVLYCLTLICNLRSVK